MKITALVTTLLLGLSTAAMASPSGYRDQREPAPVVVTPPAARDHREPAPVVIAPQETRDHRDRAPVVVAPPTIRTDGRDQWEHGHGVVTPPVQSWMQLANGQLSRGRSVVAVSSPMRWKTLKLEASGGSTFISKIAITFANGTTQVIQLDKAIDRRSPALIDLAGRSRQITKIAVYGKGGFRSQYTVLAS